MKNNRREVYIILIILIIAVISAFKSDVVEVNSKLKSTEISKVSSKISSFVSKNNNTSTVEIKTIKKADDKFHLNNYFNNDMVLQRGEPIKIWGDGLDGDEILVTIDKNKVITKVENGKWSVQFAPMEAGGPYEITFSSLQMTTTKTLKNVMIGDVWLCSGQSNMEMRLSRTVDFKVQIKQVSKYSKIRTINVPLVKSKKATQEISKTTWLCANSATLKDFISVGYNFAKELYDSPSGNVPIGIINSSVPSTSISFWLPGGELYNGMINPLNGIKIKGILWYQGCGDTKRWSEYPNDQKKLMNDWRKNLGYDNNLGFYYVQLTSFNQLGGKFNYVNFREIQRIILFDSSLGNFGMVVSMDRSNSIDSSNIHPPFKSEIGYRLSLLAREKTYGEKIESSGPQFNCVNYSDNKAVISFTHTGKKLIAFDIASSTYSEELDGFELAGVDGIFLPAKAKIIGSTVEVTTSEVLNPVYVRYCWHDWAATVLDEKQKLKLAGLDFCNCKYILYGLSDGTKPLPASQFTTAEINIKE